MSSGVWKDERLPRQAITGDDGKAGCLIIAEVAQSHDGSLGQAHAFIDAAARAGADAVKFQTHIAAAESTLQEPWRVKFSPQDESRFAYWQRMEFSPEQWDGLASHARDVGIAFLSSPFSPESVELLRDIGVPAWKIASGEVSNVLMLDQVSKTGLPVILSSGMSDWSELDAAVARVRASGTDVAVLQCATAYPCAPEQVGLNIVGELAARYGCPVGISDHSATIFPALAAVTIGASIVEVHLTLSRDMFGPDVPASITPDELQTMVNGVRFIEAMKSHPVDKDEIAEQMRPMRALFGKSVVARRHLLAGTSLSADDLALKKPGTGLPSDQFASLVGRRLIRDKRPDQLITLLDLTEAADP